jgi:hypothetical protein
MANDNRYLVADVPFYTVDGVKWSVGPSVHIGDLVFVDNAFPDEEGDVTVQTVSGLVLNVNRDALVSVSNILAAYGAVQETPTALVEATPRHRVTLASSTIRPNVLADLLAEQGGDRDQVEYIVAKALLFSAQ